MSIDKISIVVVTYNPDLDEFKQNIESYINQVSLVVIVDNSTNTVIQQQIKNIFSEYKNIHIITLEDNYGIAHAQNMGIKYSIENGFDYFIEMDQDSQLLPGYVLNIYNSYLKLEKFDFKIAGIGPVAFNKNDNSQYNHRTTVLGLIEVEKTISSGFLSSKGAINEVGYKNEKLFIDLVDLEWCWRAKSVGYKVFVDTNLKIPHLLGDGHKNFMFFKLGIPSPVRHYYQYRNALLLKKASYVPLKWKIKRTFIHLFKPIFFLFFYDKKIERIKYIIKGIKDGILGRSGKINEQKSSSQYSGFERKIAFILTKFPGVKSGVKKIYQRLNYLRYKKNYSFKSDYDIKKIGLENKESYFGYYDKSPINSTNEYIIFQSTNVNTKNMPDTKVPVDMVVYDVVNDSCEVVGQSYTYNWQQGTKLMWIDEYRFIYNEFDSSRRQYISKIYDVKTKGTQVIDFPIYDCFEDKFAITLNFERLDIARADYSYSNLGIKIDWEDNSNDGLCFVDLKENSSKLIITLKDIIKLNHKDTMNGAKHKFNHVMISPDGTKMMFMHRWFLSDGRRYDTLYVSRVDGTDIKIVADDDMVSHCFWYDDAHIFAYLRDKDKGDKYYMIDKDGKKELVGGEVIDKFGDGHPHVQGSKIIFDTYPDKARMKNLYMYDYEKKKLEKLGEFLESFDFYGETRCDLHPRFSFDGKRVFFDSVHDGKRGLYVMELNNS